VDWLAGQLSAVPGFRLRTDRLTFSRWLARDFSLTVSVPASAGRSGPVPLTYYYPYSGQTPPGGVTGRLVDLGLYPLASGLTEAFWEPARGGIAATETVWGWLEGSGNTGENIIINTHTDGPNATEENGGLGLIALARHLAALPSRNRDIYFALVTGHFQLPQFSRTILNPAHPEAGQGAVSTWMLDYPHIYQAAALGVTAEHLGATMWTDDPETG